MNTSTLKSLDFTTKDDGSLVCGVVVSDFTTNDEGSLVCVVFVSDAG